MKIILILSLSHSVNLIEIMYIIGVEVKANIVLNLHGSGLRYEERITKRPITKPCQTPYFSFLGYEE